MDVTEELWKIAEQFGLEWKKKYDRITKRLQSNDPTLNEITLDFQDLAHSGTKEETLRKIAFILENFEIRNLHSLVIKGFSRRVVDEELIVKIIRSNVPCLKSLRIIKPVPEGSAAIIDALCHNTNLTHLHIQDDGMGTDDAITISKALRSKECSIEELSLCIVDLLTWNSNYDGGFGDKGCAAIMAALGSNKSIRKLNLPGSAFGKETMSSLATNIQSNQPPFLHTLSLSGTSNADGYDFEALADALSSNSTLKALHLPIRHFKVEGYIAMIDTLSLNSTLEIIHLSIPNFNAEENAAIMNALALNSTLKSLHLFVSAANHAFAKAFASFLRCNTSKLQDIRVFYRDIDGEEIISIANALSFNTHLKALHIETLVMGSEACRALDGALRHNFSLQQLTGCRHWGDDCREFQQSIQKSLGFNRREPERAEIIKSGLFPSHLLDSLDELPISCVSEVISKIASVGGTNSVFDLVQKRPTLFDWDHSSENLAKSQEQNALVNSSGRSLQYLLPKRWRRRVKGGPLERVH